MPNYDVTLTGVYQKQNIPPSIVNPGAQEAMVGVVFSLPLAITGATTVAVSGLPKGLQYNTGAKSVMGVPKASVTNQVVTIVAKNETATVKQTFLMTVEGLPIWALGDFNGWVTDERLGSGVAVMSVTAQGKMSGKFSLGGTNYSFSTSSYSNGYLIAAVASSGRSKKALSLTVHQPTEEGSPITLGIAEGQVGDPLAGEDSVIVLFRNVWKDDGFSAVVSNYVGYYTAAQPGNNAYGSGYLTFTADKTGKVKTSGKMADGTAISFSGVLILDATGEVSTVVYAAPPAYKGGSLFGRARFVSLMGEEVFLQPFAGQPFLWKNLNPQATSVYGEGFERELGLKGGWYSKTGDLYEYYANKNLSLGTDEDANDPELIVGTNRYAAVEWRADGIAVTPVFGSGAMSGMTAPVAGKPTDADKDGVWDYSDTNSVGLKFALTRATGLFKGSFRAWFDYPPQKHVSKNLSFVGALTPVREDPDDGIEGRGYFLWPDTARVSSTGKTYKFNVTYDFLLLSE